MHDSDTQQRLPAIHIMTEALADAADRVRESTVDVRVANSMAGAGIIWNDTGLIITNAHVVDRDDVHAHLRDGSSVRARILARDMSRDLAALQLLKPVDAMRTATIADDSPLRVGQFVFAVGSPLGVAGAVTVGVVHSIERARDGVPSYIRSSVRLAPGNSGGPLADIKGRVHGVNSMIINGVGIARGNATVRRFLRRMQTGRALGVQLRPVPLLRRGNSSLGLLVTGVREQSVAERVGIAVGDILLAADGEAFVEASSLADHIDALVVDQPLQLEVGRRGRARTVSVSFGHTSGQAA